MNKITLAITITTISTLLVLITTPYSKKNVQFQKGNFRLESMNTPNTNVSIKNIDPKIPHQERKKTAQMQEITVTKLAANTQLPNNKTTTNAIYKTNNVNQTKQENYPNNQHPEENKLPKISWSTWKANAQKYINGHFLHATETLAWGVGVIMDKDANILESYAYYIPESSIIHKKATNEWWLEANEPFYIYKEKDKNVYKAFYPQNIKPKPTNLEKIVKSATVTSIEYGIEDAKKAYDKYDEITDKNDWYKYNEKGAFSLACSGGYTSIDGKQYKNKSTETQRKWACRMMDLSAEPHFVREDILKHIDAFKFPIETTEKTVFLGDIYLNNPHNTTQTQKIKN